MERRGYDAVTLGELELGQWDLAESLLTHTELPVVCTNVEQLVGAEWLPVGQRHLITEVSGVKIGILSVIGENQLSDHFLEKSGNRIRRLPPMETTREVAALLREKADIVVLLAHLDPKAMEQYASTLSNVDAILGGHVTKKDEAPILVDDVIINRSGTRGQHIACTRLIISPQNKIVDFGGLNVTLKPDLPEDPAVAEVALLARNEGQRLRKEDTQKRIEARKKEQGKRKAREQKQEQEQNQEQEQKPKP